VPEQQLDRGILDTSVVIDLERLDASQLPREVAVTSITMAELAAGPRATGDAAERARRQDRLQRAEAAFDPIPFDAAAARALGGSTPQSSRKVARPEARVPSTC
jgi:predicted nucleic acid-binding protein